MTSLRLVVPALLAAAVLAWCFTYLVRPLPARVDVDPRPTVPDLRAPDLAASTNLDQRQGAEEKAAAAYLEAAKAILRRTPNARASAGSDELPITETVPLPKRRPIAR